MFARAHFIDMSCYYHAYWYGNLFTWPAIVIINWIHCRFFVISTTISESERESERDKRKDRVTEKRINNNFQATLLECF